VKLEDSEQIEQMSNELLEKIAAALAEYPINIIEFVLTSIIVDIALMLTDEDSIEHERARVIANINRLIDTRDNAPSRRFN
jgi:hypothetical protein